MLLRISSWCLLKFLLASIERTRKVMWGSSFARPWGLAICLVCVFAAVRLDAYEYESIEMSQAGEYPFVLLYTPQQGWLEWLS
jgi:hypothetical protein